MINLIIAPRKVFKNIYYHVRIPTFQAEATIQANEPAETYIIYNPAHGDSPLIPCIETKNSYHRPDPAFTYLLSLFLFLTGIAWGVAYANGAGQTIQVAFVFVLGHFLGSSLVVATLMFFLVGRIFGKRRQGLFGPPVGGEEGLEFGYCFDVS